MSQPIRVNHGAIAHGRALEKPRPKETAPGTVHSAAAYKSSWLKESQEGREAREKTDPAKEKEKPDVSPPLMEIHQAGTETESQGRNPYFGSGGTGEGEKDAVVLEEAEVRISGSTGTFQWRGRLIEKKIPPEVWMRLSTSVVRAYIPPFCFVIAIQ